MLRLRSAGALSLVLLLAVCANAPASDNVHPALLQAMNDAPAMEMHSVIVHMVDQAPIAQLNQELKESGATLKQRHAEIVNALQAYRGTQASLQTDLENRMAGGGVEGFTSYWISNMLVVLANRDEVLEIADRADVAWIEPNFTVSLIEPIRRPEPNDGETGGFLGIGVTPGLRAVRAPEVWYELGITGEGTLAANLDTGVDGNHPALNTRWRGYQGQNPWQECWLDLLGTNTQFPTDSYGHGTHVMGTQTGLGAGTDDTVGVAWASQWIACNAINQGVGPGFDNDVITAYQWFADPDGNVNTTDDVPDVVQNSWRINENFGYDYTDCDTRWWDAIDNCEAAGVVTTWSAGNEGSGSTTIGSPADRATTLTNTFSVGAVDATNYNWPYPIAGFSSRGPTGCDVPPDRKIKPEIVAPGVDVYSSIPGGGYSDNYSGTSMSGPHVAGVVALMRQANPNLNVDTVKEIIMQTARDEGTAGEDNTYGWGHIDAYEAVLASMTGFGNIEGIVSNGSWGDVPLPGARVTLEEADQSFMTDQSGHYEGVVAPGNYTATATLEGFAPQQFQVEIIGDEVTTQNFSLTDIAGPVIWDVTQQLTAPYSGTSLPISAKIDDYSTIISATLVYRFNDGQWQERGMFGIGVGSYSGSIPVSPPGTQIDYYVTADDGLGQSGYDPADAPNDFYTTFVTNLVYDYQAEDPGDSDWTIGLPGDNASTGNWVRDDPDGTFDGSIPIQPEDDHTPAPGVKCFVTGNAGGGLGGDDVDGGCTTLLSPVFDLSDAAVAFVTYYRWYAETGSAIDDEFAVDASSDGGTSWYPVERVVNMENSWNKVTVAINDVVDLTDQIQIRYLACDLGAGGIVEAAVDDFSIESLPEGAADAPEIQELPAVTALSRNRPNPAQAMTTISFRLSNPAEADLAIYDTGGRKVRTLLSEPLMAGVHDVPWDGRDDQGHRVGSGVYFYRLKAGEFEQSRRLTLIGN